MKPIQLLPLLAFCNAGLIQAQMNKETKDSRINPGKINGKKEEMVMKINVAKIILDLDGVQIPSGMDGRSLRGLLYCEETK